MSGGTFVELCQLVCRAESNALPYRRLPYVELKKLGNGSELFDTVFNYTHFHVFQQLNTISGLKVLDARGFGKTHFPLRAEFNRDAFSDRLHLDLEFNADLIHPVVMRQMILSYEQVLSTMAISQIGRAHV